MYEYKLSVSLSDTTLKINKKIKDLIIKSAEEANSRRNAISKGRFFKILDLIDDYHIEIILFSNSEVVPTRSLSALSRSMLSLDSEGILEGHCYRGCVLNAELLSSKEQNKTNISDVEILQEIAAMLFDRTSLNNREKNMAKEASEKIKKIVIDYINKKSVSK